MLGTVRGFQLQKFLGKGTFGAVYMAKREKDGKMYAIKKVDTKKMNDSDRAEAVNEIRILASIAGNHTITFYEAFVHQDMLYIVTDFASHGDLQNFIKDCRRRRKTLDEESIWSLFMQMCLGIKTLHSRNILHRDLKAANVFMCSPSYIKLGDFGVSKVLKSSEALAKTQVGTPYYVAPEVWRNKSYNGKCDMWSLGCLLYELCTFKQPFDADSMQALARKILRGKYEPIPSHYSAQLHAVVSRLLVVDPTHRADIDEILSLPGVRDRMGKIPKQAPPGNMDSQKQAQNVDLCETIQVPRRFNDLTKNLPAARYAEPIPMANLSDPASSRADHQRGSSKENFDRARYRAVQRDEADVPHKASIASEKLRVANAFPPPTPTQGPTNPCHRHDDASQNRQPGGNLRPHNNNHPPEPQHQLQTPRNFRGVEINSTRMQSLINQQKQQSTVMETPRQHHKLPHLPNIRPHAQNAIPTREPHKPNMDMNLPSIRKAAAQLGPYTPAQPTRTPGPRHEAGAAYRDNAAVLAQMYAAMCNSNASYSNSRLSSFGGRDSGVGFNPITHQQSRYAAYVHAGSSYHSRHTPQPPAYQSRLARLHTGYGGATPQLYGVSRAYYHARRNYSSRIY